MKGMLITDQKTGSNIMVDVPDILPNFAMGTTVIAKVIDEHDQFQTVEGDIISIEIQQDFDIKENIINTTIGYKILKDGSQEVFYVHQDEIIEYYPTTNEFDAAYHVKDEQD